MKIIFVRHGKDDDRFHGGWNQRDLLPEGQRQAKRLATHLAKNQDIYRIGTIVSSDLKRVMSTTEILADARLREANNGDIWQACAMTKRLKDIHGYSGMHWTWMNAIPMAKARERFMCA